MLTPEGESSGVADATLEMLLETVPRVGVAACEMLAATDGEALGKALGVRANALGDAPLVRERAAVELAETQTLAVTVSDEDGVVTGDVLADMVAVAQGESEIELLEQMEPVMDGETEAVAKDDREKGIDGDTVVQ